MRLGLLYENRPDTPDPTLPPDIYQEMETLEAVQTLALRLEALGHSVRLIDFLRDGWRDLATVRSEVDLIYNYSVGFGSRSREVHAAAVCEYLKIPYTGSDPLTLAVAADKHLSKLLARSNRIQTPAFLVIRDANLPIDLPDGWSHCIVKPMYEGSSIGVTGPIETEDHERVHDVIRNTLADYGYGVLVEEFIAGYEVTVPVLGTEAPRALPPVAMMLDGDMELGMRTFAGALKVDLDPVSWTADVPFARRTISKLQDWAVRIHKALGCRDLSRSDFRVTKGGRPFYLETNPTPQMTPEGGTFCCAAEAIGMRFDEVLGEVVQSAAARYRAATPRTIPH
jgi:D-alanine-D-alanine ligase